jgi:hypothetical protein
VVSVTDPYGRILDFLDRGEFFNRLSYYQLYRVRQANFFFYMNIFFSVWIITQFVKEQLRKITKGSVHGVSCSKLLE